MNLKNYLRFNAFLYDFNLQRIVLIIQKEIDFFCTAIVYYSYIPQRRTILRSLIGLGRVKHECFRALAAILTIFMSGHENASAALFTRTFAAESVDLAVFVNLNSNKIRY